MKRLVIALILLSVLPAQASLNYEQAVVAYDRGRFEEAHGAFSSLAETGHPGAEFMLGAIYFYGKGVPRSDKLAAIWFHKAAVQGNAHAQLAFGSLYIRGVGVRQDLIRAHAWLSIAAGSEVRGLRQQAAALRDEAAKLMRPDEIEDAARIARSFEPRAAGLVR